jgi:hypothetical protein
VHEATGGGREVAMAVLRWESAQVWGGGAMVGEDEPGWERKREKAWRE